MIRYLQENIEIPVFDLDKISHWIKTTALGYGKKTGDINYIFCNDDKILQINQQYLQHDYFTDIITFDYSTDKIISGDIFIGLETVEANAKEFNTDFTTELYRIIIHGILHLCGQDDKEPAMRMEMTRKENEALEKLTLILN